MSDINLIQRIHDLERDVEQLRSLEARDLLLPTVSYALSAGITVDTVVCGMVLTRVPIYINRFQINCRVNTTNNGSNYWTIYLVTAVGGGAITTVNTSALSPSSTVWSRLNGTIGSQVTSPEIGLYVRVIPTGSPGALDIIGVLVNAA